MHHRIIARTIVLVFVVGFLLPSTPSTTHSQGRIADDCTGNCQIYLPLTQTIPAVPQLGTPPDRTPIITLAPTLSWTPPVSGTYNLQIANDSIFASIALSVTTTLLDTQPMSYTLDSNLLGATTYYWRVGVRMDTGTFFSAPQSFITPKKDLSLLPPRPQLLTPANGASVLATSTDLTWQSIPDTLYYRINVYDSQHNLFASQRLNVSTYTLSGITLGTSYTWEVKALNQYGWGTYPAPWAFQTH